MSADRVTCTMDPCKNSGTCTTTPKGVFSCQCKYGYTGLFCETTYSTTAPAIKSTMSTQLITSSVSTASFTDTPTSSTIYATTTSIRSTKTGLSSFHIVTLLDNQTVCTRSGSLPFAYMCASLFIANYHCQHCSQHCVKTRLLRF